ncbi:Peptidase C10 family protein [Cedecea sp. NFIX57]|nr:Peptidase C10 family protein [Cedecea sp. NFIX57]
MDEVKNIIRRELDEGRIVFLGVLAHAVYCDGYRDDGLFAINWGWGDPSGATSNSWYDLEKLDFFDAHIGIQPAVNEVLFADGVYAENLSLSPVNIGDVSLSVFTKEMPFDGFLKLALTDDSHVLRSYISGETIFSMASNKEESITLTYSVPDDITFGSRNIEVFYSQNGKTSGHFVTYKTT